MRKEKKNAIGKIAVAVFVGAFLLAAALSDYRE